MMKFYTIKLPKVLGSLVRAMLGAFKKGWYLSPWHLSN